MTSSKWTLPQIRRAVESHAGAACSNLAALDTYRTPAVREDALRRARRHARAANKLNRVREEMLAARGARLIAEQTRSVA